MPSRAICRSTVLFSVATLVSSGSTSNWKRVALPQPDSALRFRNSLVSEFVTGVHVKVMVAGFDRLITLASDICAMGCQAMPSAGCQSMSIRQMLGWSPPTITEPPAVATLVSSVGSGVGAVPGGVRVCLTR